MALTDKLSSVANAIRGKTGKTGSLTLEQMVTEINSLQIGGGGSGTEGGAISAHSLKNITISSETSLVAGQEFSCILQADDGYYLPPVISVSGTNSAYGFYYDYTTGVVRIPANEVVGSVVISAEGSKFNWDVPAQLMMEKEVADKTHDGTTEYTNETFLLLDIYPCRGSVVTVTYDGLTKTVTGELSTDTYDSNAVQVFFGTFHGVSDDVETASSGLLTISGAYESYGCTKYATDDKGIDSLSPNGGCVLSVINTGGIRYCEKESFYFSNNIPENEETWVVFNNPVDRIEQAFFSGSVNIKFQQPVKNIVKCLYAGLIPASIGAIYHNNVPLWDSWFETANGAYYGMVYTEGVDAYIGFNDLIDENAEDKIYQDIYLNGFNVRSIETIQLTSCCKKISSCSISNYNSLKELVIPSSVEIIEKMPLWNCLALESIIIEEGNPNYYSESNCIIDRENKIVLAGCKNSVIPNDATTIDDYAFCSLDIQSVAIPSSATSIGEYAFAYTSLTSATFQEGLLSIGDVAFGCTSLTSITIPSTVTSIGVEAFAHAPITSATFQEGLLSIGELAFNNALLTSITIPSTVTSIGKRAFANAPITSVTMLPTTPPTLGGEKPFNIDNITSITVPAGTGDAYKAAKYWSDYADYIVEATS